MFPFLPAATQQNPFENQGLLPARWIAAEPESGPPMRGREGRDISPEPSAPLPVFRRDFQIAGRVAHAVVHVSGLGHYELHVNGQPVTDTVLNPGWTDYQKTILYDSFDVTRLLHTGANVLGVLLGNGMYHVANVPGRYRKFSGSFGKPKLILDLEIKLADGSSERLVSDGQWQTAPGPIIFSHTYGGEDFDARKWPIGWDKPLSATPEAGESGWRPVTLTTSPGGVLKPESADPIRVVETLRPVRVSEPEPGIQLVDFGRNFAGWPKIRVKGAVGSVVKLIGGELLDEHGRVSQRSAAVGPGDENSFSYILSGQGEETWRPRFSYWGFRYLEVRTSHPAGSAAPKIVSVEGEVVHADVPVVGHFECSDPLLNRIHTLICRAIVSNMVSVLTDCPHREKLGWLEQTHLAGSAILYNYDASKLYRKISDDMSDAQGKDGLVPSIAPEFVAFLTSEGYSTAFRDTPEWGIAVVLTPWVAYQFTGAPTSLEAHYANMRRYLEYLQGKAENRILAYGLGDWYDIGPGDPGFSQLTGVGFTGTAVYYQALRDMEQIAKITGHEQDIKGYRDEAEQVKTAFNAKFFHPETNTYDRGSQTACAMPLVLGLVPEQSRAAVLDRLVEAVHVAGNHVTAGDVGFHYVVRALTDGGRSDVLYDMLSRTDSPSYGFQLANGATTLTEAWDTNPTSSQNHFMLGHGEEWFYRGLAGIDFDLSRPVGKQLVIKPTPVGDLTYAKATYASVRGKIESGWTRDGKSFEMTIEIPAGLSAEVIVPSEREAIRIDANSLDNARFRVLASEGESTTVSLPGGRHVIRTTVK